MTKSKPVGFARLLDDAPFGTSGVASLEMIPKLLVERFGEPSPGDGNKVSGMFAFSNGDGVVYTIYDWKLTDPESSPGELWDLDEVVLLSIGSNSRNRAALSRFLSWLDQALADGLAADQDWLASLTAESCSAANQVRVLQLLDHGGKKTQLAALELVRRIGEPLATPILFRQLWQLMRLGQPIRPAVIKAFSAFASQADTDWVQALMVERLNSESAETRRTGLVVLTTLGPKVWTEGVLTRFSDLLTEEATAEEALSSMSPLIARLGRTLPPPTPAIASRVAKHLVSDNPSIRRHAADATVVLGGSAGALEVLVPLFRMLGEANWRARITAEMTFKRLGDVAAPPGLLEHLCQCVRSEDFQVKASALRVARSIANATGDREAGRRLVKVLKGPSATR